MSLEQRVTILENQNRETNERLNNIEISVKNTQDGVKQLFLHSLKHERQIEALDQKVDRLEEKMDKRFEQIDERFEQIDERFEQIDKRFDKIDERFDKVEDTLAIIVNHLQN